jgi:putative radical SAM enzyme (TIGR03279 family)
MPGKKGITIESIAPESLADAAGLQPGDVITSINAMSLRDVIDFMYYKDADVFDIEYLRDKAKKKIRIISDSCSDLGITFRPLKVKTCKNNCIFCFVKQLPKGLRKSLYVKDEDYRLSFLYGNYTTLSNLTDEERRRIVEQRLSPLYISVHATNKALRNRMLGNPKASDIKKELKFFADHKIRMHIQIVLCPGFNDGKELQNTVQDVYKFYPYTSSIAIVPVGLTKHRKMQLAPVKKDDACKAIATVDSFQKRFRKKHGESIVYCADEMYIRAEMPFPSLSAYGELPQIENGVGLIPLFMSQARKVKVSKSEGQGKKFLTFTGASFYPYLKKYLDRLSEKEGITIDVIPIENTFFGPEVTVTGLLTGRDIISALHDNTDHYDTLIMPEVVLREGDSVLLDNVSVSDIEEATGLNVMVTDGTPQGLIDTVITAGSRD